MMSRKPAGPQCQAHGLLGPQCISAAVVTLTLACNCDDEEELTLCTGHATRHRQKVRAGTAFCPKCRYPGHLCRYPGHLCQQVIRKEVAV